MLAHAWLIARSLPQVLLPQVMDGGAAAPTAAPSQAHVTFFLLFHHNDHLISFCCCQPQNLLPSTVLFELLCIHHSSSTTPVPLFSSLACSSSFFLIPPLLPVVSTSTSTPSISSSHPLSCVLLCCRLRARVVISSRDTLSHRLLERLLAASPGHRGHAATPPPLEPSPLDHSTPVWFGFGFWFARRRKPLDSWPCVLRLFASPRGFRLPKSASIVSTLLAEISPASGLDCRSLSPYCPFTAADDVHIENWP